MISSIRKTTRADLDEVMEIYAVARRLMQRAGNSAQWVNGYPSKELILAEIGAGHSFVCIDDEKNIVATFCFVLGDEPTYKVIYDGKWLNDDPYGTIHRLASCGKEKNVAEACFKWCFSRRANIRVDTHRDNKIMRSILQKLDFSYCGIIFVSNGTERLAYQKIM